MSEEKDGIKVKATVGVAEIEAKGGGRTIASADHLAASLIDVAAFLPRLTANYTNELLERQTARFRAVADKAMTHISDIPEGQRIEPSDKIKRAIVVGAAVEDDPSIQEIWARFLARSADAREKEPDLLLANTIERMTHADLVFFENLRQALNKLRSQVVSHWVGRRVAELQVIDLSALSSDQEKMLGRLVDTCVGDIVDTIPEVVSSYAKDRLLAIGVIAPVSGIDATTTGYLDDLINRSGATRLNLGAKRPFEDDVEAMLERVQDELKEVVVALVDAFDVLKNRGFRLTNMGNRLFELAEGVSVSSFTKITYQELCDLAWDLRQ